MEIQKGDERVSENICPLATLGQESFEPATCQTTNNPCPHINYYEKYRSCPRYLEWLRKIVRVKQKGEV